MGDFEAEIASAVANELVRVVDVLCDAEAEFTSAGSSDEDDVANQARQFVDSRLVRQLRQSLGVEADPRAGDRHARIGGRSGAGFLPPVRSPDAGLEQLTCQWFSPRSRRALGERGGIFSPDVLQALHAGMFSNRQEAGVRLADALAGELADAPAGSALVLGLPRGGVVVGAEIARRLGAALDVFLTRKLGAPGDPELAIGAVTETGYRSLNSEVIDLLRVPDSYIEQETRCEEEVIRRLAEVYRAGRPLPAVLGRHVIVTDDGAATGATIRAALCALRDAGPQRLIAGLPVAPRETARDLEALAGRVIVLEMPEPFLAVGAYYEDFRQVTDEEVISILGSRPKA